MHSPLEAVQWIVPLYLRELGYSVLDYGLLISAQTLIIAFGGTFAGTFVDRFESVNALSLSYLVVALSLLAFLREEAIIERQRYESFSFWNN